jgi:hypothetical protein
VETKIPVLDLGTGSGESQWCNWLPLSPKLSRPCPPEAALKYTPALIPRAHFVLLCVHFAATFPKAPFR